MCSHHLILHTLPSAKLFRFVSADDNICVPDAQYYELSAQQNLWCEILEFWAFEAISLIHSWLWGLPEKYVNKRVVKVALLRCHSACFAA